VPRDCDLAPPVGSSTLRFLSPAACLLLLAFPLVAEDEKCWVCGEAAKCVESTLANLARKTCRSTDVCAQDTCVTICTTGSEECAIESPDDDPSDHPPWWPWNHPDFLNTLILAAQPDATEVVSETFDSLMIGVLATQSLQGSDVGWGDGMIAFDDRSSYRFSRSVDVDRSGMVTATYRLERHPVYSYVTVESPSRGVDIFVTVEQVDGGQRFETFAFDPFGSAPGSAGRSRR